ncbi:MAG: Sec-independent protein translocase protein TatB [Sulfurimonadaceae bacterium]|jgi:sec-independent protein translocase protein TatB|nr:Sec-independent protein translocase protein TatB [Sulfurimonadaceae bacterium]
MFGLGFAEILIIVVIAILFLGPDKLPSAMVEVAKFFRSAKKTIHNVKESLEQEMNVADIKNEALSYKQDLLKASAELQRTTDLTQLGSEMAKITDDITKEVTKPETPKQTPLQETITFEKKSTQKEDKADV